MGRLTARRRIIRLGPDAAVQRVDALAVEEPLELRVGGQSLSVTMRTPGHDVELAHGFLLTEGIIGSAADVVTARYCQGTDPDGRQTYNVLDVVLADGVAAPGPGVARNFTTTSSCGVCGKGALESVRLRTRHCPAGDAVVLDPAVLRKLPGALRSAQRVFDSTGGLHAAGLYESDGTAVAVREDIGRHNAVDKVLGAALLAGRVPAAGTVLMVSGRASFELVQKAAMAGVSTLAAVSAPSSLAAELAEDEGITLIGFLRGDSMNIYTRPDRLKLD
jgi:FdhD protein